MSEKIQCRRIFYMCIYYWLCQEHFVSQTLAEFCFDANKEGHRLNTVVLRKVYTLSVPECALRCFDDPCCRSANFNKGCLSSEGRDNCELLHHVTSDQPGQLMLDENFDHLVLLQPHRVFNCSCVPCKKSERCFENLKNCSCPFGFDGDKCIEAGVSCGTFNWWENSGYTNEWSNCPSFSPFMSGLKRNTAASPIFDKLISIVGKKCCNITKMNLDPECLIDDRWIKSFDNFDTWNECPDGYFLNGLKGRNKKESVLPDLDLAKCCKLRGSPNKYSDCYEEDVSKSFHFTQAGMSQCSKEKYFITGLYRSECPMMHCITKFRCCRMEYI